MLCTLSRAALTPPPPGSVPHTQLSRQESFLDFGHSSAVACHNKVRAFAGWPGTRATFNIEDRLTGEAGCASSRVMHGPGRVHCWPIIIDHHLLAARQPQPTLAMKSCTRQVPPPVHQPAQLACVGSMRVLHASRLSLDCTMRQVGATKACGRRCQLACLEQYLFTTWHRPLPHVLTCCRHCCCRRRHVGAHRGQGHAHPRRHRPRGACVPRRRLRIKGPLPRALRWRWHAGDRRGGWLTLAGAESAILVCAA